ncbi:MAG: hypothetical protein ABIF77_02605 [bacterium]
MATISSSVIAVSSRQPLICGTAMLGLLVMTVLMTGCEIEKPVAPTFSTSMTIPIGEERIDIAEVIEDQDHLVVGSDSCLSFTLDGSEETIELDFDLGMDIPTDNFAAEVGVFELDVIDPISFQFELGELYPEAIDLHGWSLPIPAFNFDLESDPNEFADLESAVLEAGLLRVTIRNGLDVPVSGSDLPDRILIKLIDPVSATTIAALDFPQPIAPDAEVTRTADLAGMVMPGCVTIQLSGGSPGSPTPIQINTYSDLEVVAELSGLQASSCTAAVDAQTFTTDFVTTLPDSIDLVSAEIAEGHMIFDLTNGLAIPCQVRMVWDGVLNPAGATLVTNLAMAPNSAATMDVDLAGHTICNVGGGTISEIDLDVEISTPGSGGASVTLDATDELEAVIRSGSLTFASLTGSVSEQVYELDPVTEELELPDELSGLSLTTANLVLEVDNGIGMPAQLVAILTGTGEGGSRVTLDLDADIAPGLDGGRQLTTVVLDESNSNITDFLNSMPDEITVTGAITVGGAGLVGTVRAGESTTIRWWIEAPLEVVIENSVLKGDPDDLDFDEDTRDMIYDHAEGALVVTAITNHMPFAVDIRILVSQDSLTIDTHPQLIVGPLSVAAGQLDPLLHTVSAATLSAPTLELTREEARIFALPHVYTLLEVTLPSSDGQPVRVRNSDYLTVTGAVTLDVLVSNND